MHPLLMLATAGAGLGWAEKTGLLDKLPAVPLIGRKGTLAAVAFALRRSSPFAMAVSAASALAAGLEYGQTGKVSGQVEAEPWPMPEAW